MLISFPGGGELTVASINYANDSASNHVGKLLGMCVRLTCINQW